jgi:hypothetical protein
MGLFSSHCVAVSRVFHRRRVGSYLDSPAPAHETSRSCPAVLHSRRSLHSARRFSPSTLRRLLRSAVGGHGVGVARIVANIGVWTSHLGSPHRSPHWRRAHRHGHSRHPRNTRDDLGMELLGATDLVPPNHRHGVEKVVIVVAHFGQRRDRCRPERVLKGFPRQKS